MTLTRIAASAFFAAAVAAGFSGGAQSQGASPGGTIIGAQSSDEQSARQRPEVEAARLKALNQVPAVQKRLDQVKTAVKAAQAAMQAKNYLEALTVLARFDTLTDKTAEETYLIERTRVAIASLTSDDALLIKSLEATLASAQGPATERTEFAEVLVRKYFNQKNYPKAVAWSVRYFEEGGKDPAIRRAQVFAYYLNSDYARARQEVFADIQTEEAAGKTPSEEQLRLLVSCAQKLDDKAAYASAVEKYAAYYPKKP